MSIDLLKFIKDRTLIIAEIGCNHNGDFEIAKELVKIAAASGADVVKFQSFVPEDMITVHAPKAEYQIKATGTEESQYDRLKRMSLSHQKQLELKEYCDLTEIIFSSSPFDFSSADFLNSINIPFFKIPSGEITNIPLLEHIGSFGKPVILSTGMANLGEIEEAIKALGEENREKIILMHCLSNYPASWEESNLNAIKTLNEVFHMPVGFSDHTEGIELALVAAGLGCRVIEKHITPDRNMEGGDHKASLEPREFKDLVEKIRLLEKAMGNGIKQCMPSEENVKKVARKSIVANRRIGAGQILGKEDLAVKRPGTGIEPKFLEMVTGSKAKTDIEQDQLISWSMLETIDS